jgi:hypothetical protein
LPFAFLWALLCWDWASRACLLAIKSGDDLIVERKKLSLAANKSPPAIVLPDFKKYY